MAKPRYTLHYTYRVRINAGKWDEDWFPRHESMDFKTIGEAKDYLSIAGENAYIIDNVTGKKII